LTCRDFTRKKYKETVCRPTGFEEGKRARTVFCWSIPGMFYRVVMVVVLVCAGGAAGGPVVNGSFETGDLTGWTPGIAVGDPSNPWATWGRFVASEAPPNPAYQPAPPSVLPAEGNYFAVLHHDGHPNSNHSIFQDISITDTDTVLRFWLNVDLNPHNPYGQGQGSWAWVTLEERRPGGSSYRLVTFGGAQNGMRYGTDGWQLMHFDLNDYTTYTQLRIRFELQTGNNYSPGHHRLMLDGVSLVPEPACLTLLALGAGVLVRRPRRTRA